MHCYLLESEPRGIQISPIGAISKKKRLGKWRVITDLSSPAGKSINNAISKNSLPSNTLQWIIYHHLSFQRATSFLVKADIKEAYRMVLVHPDEQSLLGVLWDGRVYIDRMLPFGLSSAVIIFSAVADTLQWISNQETYPKVTTLFG